MDTITHEKLVEEVMKYPAGCEEGKKTFLMTAFGIDANKYRPKSTFYLKFLNRSGLYWTNTSWFREFAVKSGADYLEFDSKTNEAKFRVYDMSKWNLMISDGLRGDTTFRNANNEDIMNIVSVRKEA